MLRQKALLRFYVCWSLFAILLIVVCPVITQTIALMTKPSENNQLHTAPSISLSHFECASKFYKDNNLDPNDFISDPIVSHSSAEEYNELSKSDSNNMDHDQIVSCGYCDLIHSATILVAYYIFLFEAPSSDVVLVATNPYIFPSNFWSILTRAPPANLIMS